VYKSQLLGGREGEGRLERVGLSLRPTIPRPFRERVLVAQRGGRLSGGCLRQLNLNRSTDIESAPYGDLGFSWNRAGTRAARLGSDGYLYTFNVPKPARHSRIMHRKPILTNLPGATRVEFLGPGLMLACAPEAACFFSLREGKVEPVGRTFPLPGFGQLRTLLATPRKKDPRPKAGDWEGGMRYPNGVLVFLGSERGELRMLRVVIGPLRKGRLDGPNMIKEVGQHEGVRAFVAKEGLSRLCSAGSGERGLSLAFWEWQRGEEKRWERGDVQTVPGLVAIDQCPPLRHPGSMVAFVRRGPDGEVLYQLPTSVFFRDGFKVFDLVPGPR